MIVERWYERLFNLLFNHDQHLRDQRLRKELADARKLSQKSE